MGNQILGSDGIVIRQGIYEQKATQEADLGRFVDFQDGRRFRYCKCNSEAGITRGHMCSAAALDGNANLVIQTSMATQPAGETEIEVLLSASVAAHLFRDGFLTIETDAGAGASDGYIYRIKDNTAGGLTVATPCKLILSDPLQVALTANSTLSLTVNKYQDVVVTPTIGETASPIGVPLIDITESYYFWAQTRGYAALMADTTTAAAAGESVSIGAADGVCIKSTGTTEKTWGVCIQPAVTSTYATIDLMLE
ncbi:unnamed protein product [marine sediment metagenome]|uniref:Uncharacterized protein n=1 Tax=marine sediment metagenome TaxID=412755 RepID=X1GSS2_9ZZZZ